jgi:ABC-2 type transport system permease protein
VNLFALAFFLGGVTTLISAPDRHRWRTIGIAGGFCIVEMVIEAVGLMVDRLAWLKYLTFYSAYKPPRLVAHPDQALEMAALHCGLLLGVGLAGYLAAGFIFQRRDLPAPL